MKRPPIPILLLLLLPFLLPPRLPAGPIEDPGPWPVGWRDVTFVDEIFGEGEIRGRVYYPALSPGRMTEPDVASGPYPLVAFMHGWLGRPGDYDDLCTHLAGWGFVVASTGTETGLFPNTDRFARDTRAFLHWVDAESHDPGAWLFGMAWDGDWGASGHSMGGGTLSLLIGYEPRVRVIIGLQSAALGAGIDNMRSYTGDAFQVAGEVDLIVPPGVVHGWFEEAISAARDIFYQVNGMGHMGPTDNPPGNEPLSGDEQARLHRRLVTGLFRAEIQGEEDLYADLLGEGIDGEPVARQADCAEPVFWARVSALAPDVLVTGIAGGNGDRVGLAGSLRPDSVVTRFGLLGLDRDALTVFSSGTLTPKGWTEVTLPFEPQWAGRTLYLQGLTRHGPGEGAFTRVAEVAIP
jgi:dienelactone hydrolase